MTAQKHSIARLFPEYARRQAASAFYRDSDDAKPMPRAQYGEEQLTGWCPVGIMLLEARLDVLACPSATQAARALGFYKVHVDPHLRRGVILELNHFMSNFDAGKYKGILPEVLGVSRL